MIPVRSNCVDIERAGLVCAVPGPADLKPAGLCITVGIQITPAAIGLFPFVRMPLAVILKVPPAIRILILSVSDRSIAQPLCFLL